MGWIPGRDVLGVLMVVTLALMLGLLAMAWHTLWIAAGCGLLVLLGLELLLLPPRSPRTRK